MMILRTILVIIGGIITNIKTKATKQDRLMSFIAIEDLTGTMEVIVFPMVYENIGIF